MKLRIFISIIAFATLFSFSSKSKEHPLKLSASEIIYDTEAKTIRMKCRVFIDDFSMVVNKTLLKDINLLNLTKEDKAGIQNYFNAKYKISVNGKMLPLKFKSYRQDYRIMYIEFSETDITLKKGDTLYVENSLLFEAFGSAQSNWIALRIPPFVPNNNFESKLGNHTYSQTL